MREIQDSGWRETDGAGQDTGIGELAEGRPERDSAICQDDIVNLQIALHTAGSLEELFRLV